jgi:hypothetical protein
MVAAILRSTAEAFQALISWCTQAAPIRTQGVSHIKRSRSVAHPVKLGNKGPHGILRRLMCDGRPPAD